MKALCDILSKDKEFTHLTLAHNNIGYEGIKFLSKLLKQNNSLIALDLSGNNFTCECATLLFDTLKDNDNIISLNISNANTLHKNRMGPRGCISLKELLQSNKVLTFLNIADNFIGVEGLKYIIEGLADNTILLSLNLSGNNLPSSIIQSCCKVILSSSLTEIGLRQNELDDKVISTNLVGNGRFKGAYL